MKLPKLSAHIRILLALFATRAAAIDITLDFNTNADQFPSFDPDGSKLAAVSLAAAQIWEQLQPAGATFDWDIHYENLDPNSNTLAIANSLDGSIRVRNNFTGPNWAGSGWFFDPTPLDNSEFGPFTQEFFRDASFSQQALFPNSAPDLLEIGYFAPGLSGDAASFSDLLSLMLHEMGHLSGITFNDFAPDVPIPSQFVGNMIGVKVVRADDGHVGPENALMFPTLTRGERRLPSALDVMANANEKGWSEVKLARVDWIGNTLAPGTHSWTDAAGWAGGKVPGSTTDVTIRNEVDVTHIGAAGFAQRLLIAEESSLSTVETLSVGLDVEVRGNSFYDHPQIVVGSGGSLDVGRNLVLALGSVEIAGGTVDIGNLLLLGPGVVGVNATNESRISGHGTVTVGVQLRNRGVIRADGGVLTIIAGPGGELDLDGNSENTDVGAIRATAGSLDFQGALSDAFNGTAKVGAGQFIHFDHDFATSGGTVEFKTGAGLAELADKSSATTIAFNDDTAVTVEADTSARIAAGQIVFHDSTASVAAGSVLTLVGPLSLIGSTLGGSSSAVIRQNGNTIVSGNNVVDVGEYDWDGALATPVNTTISPASKLTINAVTLGGAYAGDVTLGSGAQLVVNMTGAQPAWTLAPQGKITFEENGKLSGSLLSVTGRIEALGGVNAIHAPLIVEPPAQIVVADKVALNFKGATEFKGGLIGTLSGSMEGSTIGIFAAADVRGAQSITAGFFNWDGSDDTDSLTTVPAGSALTVTALKVGTFDGTRASFGDTASFGGTLNMNIGGELSGYGTFLHFWTLDANGTLILDGVPGVNTPVITGSQIISHGLVRGSGEIHALLENNGTIEVGHDGAIGALASLGGFTQRKDGTLRIELGGTTPGTGYDQLTLALNGKLAGTLDVDFLGGYLPAYGDTFRVVGGTATLTGTFDTLNLPPLSGDGWEVTYGTNFVDIRAIPEPSSLLLLGLGAIFATARRRIACFTK